MNPINVVSARKMQQPIKTAVNGFTLIELMVIILIAGLLVTFASLSVSNSSDQQIKTEARKFTALVKLAADEAIINSQEFILVIEQQQYYFETPGPDGQMVQLGSDDPVFRARELPDHMHLGGEIAGEKLTFQTDRLGDVKPAKIGIFSSGEMTPFILEFSQDDGVAFEVASDYSGNVEFLGKVK